MGTINSAPTVVLGILLKVIIALLQITWNDGEPVLCMVYNRHIFAAWEESGEFFMMAEQVLADLKRPANAQNVEGMARFGIRPANVFGISMPTLRKMAKGDWEGPCQCVSFVGFGDSRGEGYLLR